MCVSIEKGSFGRTCGVIVHFRSKDEKSRTSKWCNGGDGQTRVDLNIRKPGMAKTYPRRVVESGVLGTLGKSLYKRG